MMTGIVRRYAGMFRAAFRDFLDDGALQLGAAVSFYAVLSLSPLLLVVVGIAGWIGGREAIAARLIGEVRNLVGDAGAEVAKTVLESADEPKKGVVAVIVGAVTLLFGATGVFVQLQAALNTIWEVEAKPRSGIWSFIRNRLLSLAMVMGIGFLLLVSLVLSAGITAANERFVAAGPSVGWLGHAVHFISSLLVMTMLFALLFKILPDVKIAWRDVWVGACITGILMTLGKFAIGLYLGHSTIGSGYGAAGSLVVFFVWIYYASLIVFLGAELTQVYANRYNRAASPTT